VLDTATNIERKVVCSASTSVCLCVLVTTVSSAKTAASYRDAILSSSLVGGAHRDTLTFHVNDEVKLVLSCCGVRRVEYDVQQV